MLHMWHTYILTYTHPYIHRWSINTSTHRHSAQARDVCRYACTNHTLSFALSTTLRRCPQEVGPGAATVHILSICSACSDPTLLRLPSHAPLHSSRDREPPPQSTYLMSSISVSSSSSLSCIEQQTLPVRIARVSISRQPYPSLACPRVYPVLPLPVETM